MLKGRFALTAHRCANFLLEFGIHPRSGSRSAWRPGKVFMRQSKALTSSMAAILLLAPCAGAQSDAAFRQLGRDIFQQLIEINTTDSVGSTTVAAEAMAKRFRDAGFPASDVTVLGPNDRKGNVVVRLRGTGSHRPILLWAIWTWSRPADPTGPPIPSNWWKRTAIFTAAARRI